MLGRYLLRVFVGMYSVIKPELTVVVPCFNERENIRPLVDLLGSALGDIQWEVVFVDDDSPDGTAQEVIELSESITNVRLLHRIGRRGLAGACIEGILSSSAPLVAVMDADLQHDERKLANMYSLMLSDETVDLTVGSRHVEGGSASGGLSKIRSLGSDLAIGLARKTLKINVSDPMSGYFMVRRTSFNQVVTNLQPQGFKILADMISASRGRWKIKEIGYEFRSRQFGESKMDAAVTLEYMGLVASRLTGGVLPIRFILFLAVGLSGVFVQLLAVKFALDIFLLPFYLAQSLGVWLAMTSNFWLNNLITYRDRKLRGFSWWKGLVSFYAVCLLGAIANVAVADWVNQMLNNWVIASSAGAIFGALWNFTVSSIFTWKAR